MSCFLWRWKWWTLDIPSIAGSSHRHHHPLHCYESHPHFRHHFSFYLIILIYLKIFRSFSFTHSHTWTPAAQHHTTKHNTNNTIHLHVLRFSFTVCGYVCVCWFVSTTKTKDLYILTWNKHKMKRKKITNSKWITSRL